LGCPALVDVISFQSIKIKIKIDLCMIRLTRLPRQ
jgi:hypothetical protein